MAYFIPFNSRNLEISLFAFGPTVVLVGDLIDVLKHFSLCTETLGCVQSSLIQSIHGNMILWYGAWLKKSCEDKEALTMTLLSMLGNISSVAVLDEHTFFDSYAGDPRDGRLAAKFCTGDTVSMSIAALTVGNDMSDLSYACLALFKSSFLKLDGVTSGVCLKCQSKPIIACFLVWKSLHSCYSWLLGSNQRSSMLSMLPYLERFPLDLQYDVFRVVYVSGDNALNVRFFLLIKCWNKAEKAKNKDKSCKKNLKKKNNNDKGRSCTYLTLVLKIEDIPNWRIERHIPCLRNLLYLFLSISI